MSKGKGIKIIVSMIGLDGHTTGGEVVSMLLRDAGFEVVYLGVNQTPQSIVDAAIQEDVDAIGISSHAANYSLIEELMDLVRAKGLDDVIVVVGGNIPKQQILKLAATGIAKVFTPGSASSEIVDFLVANVRRLPGAPDSVEHRAA
ncbi:MAG: cobalamin B12-binding domain-containing protein [Rhodocyclales bacterium]|nr:cobalamin B12-binding domain-containing protein [Rhodocyclales bacterium]